MNTLESTLPPSVALVTFMVTVGEDCLYNIRRMITEKSRQMGFDGYDVTQIVMAVDEACTNVIRHSYRVDRAWIQPGRAPEIRLSIGIMRDRLVIEINDHGQPFDFAAYRNSEIHNHLQEMRTSGYGIPIICWFMNEVRYHSDPRTGNTLRLIKCLPRPSVAYDIHGK